MRLEPYVEGEIDWNVSPSESPFWVGSVGDLRDELFEETGERFVALYWSDQNPAVASALDSALRSMVVTVTESLSEAGEHPPDGEVWRSIWSLGSGGYVWRVAESDAQTSDVNLRADLAKEVEAIVESFPLEDSVARARARLGVGRVRASEPSPRLRVSGRLGRRRRVPEARFSPGESAAGARTRDDPARRKVVCVLVRRRPLRRGRVPREEAGAGGRELRGAWVPRSSAVGPALAGSKLDPALTE